MAPVDDSRFAHVIASVDLDKQEGRIRYVLPSRMKTGAPVAGAGELDMDDVTLVLKNAAGEEIGRVRAELRFESCVDDHAHRRAIIQQDLEITDSLAEIELQYHGAILDTFKPEPNAPPSGDIAGGLSLSPAEAGHENRRTLNAPGVEARSGVSYMVQAKPDNSIQWQTLAVGQSVPQFSIDKNQFPGATSVEVRVVQNAGFAKHTISESVIDLGTGLWTDQAPSFGVRSGQFVE